MESKTQQIRQVLQGIVYVGIAVGATLSVGRGCTYISNQRCLQARLQGESQIEIVDENGKQRNFYIQPDGLYKDKSLKDFIEIKDLNGDGLGDLIFTEDAWPTSKRAEILLNQGDGTYQNYSLLSRKLGQKKKNLFKELDRNFIQARSTLKDKK